ADKKLYALRDVTATVDAVPLIASSIMSKKLAGGARTVVLDVKWGSGAFMRTVEEARTLAAELVRIGEGAGRRTRALLSPMREPLGRAVGNALEVREAIETLRGDGPDDLWRLTLELGAHQLVLAGLAASVEEGHATLTRLRDDGTGARKLEELIEAQGGDPRVVADPGVMAAAPHVVPLPAPADGWVAAADAREIGIAALELGAGRRVKTDPVDPAVGVMVRARIGDHVQAGQPLADIHARDHASAARAADRLREAFRVSPDAVPVPDPGYEIVG
ncbi:MAG TPA: thymidine phosphorylase, partial [Longimicrobiaceae bacterium]|nr:thymidine phosphorylase [Longimicrobiaceae bacterium]